MRLNKGIFVRKYGIILAIAILSTCLSSCEGKKTSLTFRLTDEQKRPVENIDFELRKFTGIPLQHRLIAKLKSDRNGEAKILISSSDQYLLRIMTKQCTYIGGNEPLDRLEIEQGLKQITLVKYSCKQW